MSDMGQTRTSQHCNRTSPLLLKADIRWHAWHVRNVPKTDRLMHRSKRSVAVSVALPSS